VVHFNVTSNPTAQWAAQQMIDAFPFEEAPPYAIRDRDGIYGDYFCDRVNSMDIEQASSKAAAPAIPTLSSSIPPRAAGEFGQSTR